MFSAERFRSLLAERGLSQTEFGRRIGLTQQTVARLASGNSYGSKHIHRIARELGTSPAYLMGETDDPAPDAPITLRPEPEFAHVLLAVALPPERALARMFEVLLAGLPDGADRDEQALLLAQRLPIGLAQLRDLLPASTVQPGRASQPAFATLDAEPSA